MCRPYGAPNDGAQSPPFKRWATLWRPSGTPSNAKSGRRTLTLVKIFCGTDSYPLTNGNGRGSFSCCPARLFVSNRLLQEEPEMTFDFSKSVAGPTEPDRPSRLEFDLQSDLHHAVASRADKRIAGREVWGQ